MHGETPLDHRIVGDGHVGVSGRFGLGVFAVGVVGGAVVGRRRDIGVVVRVVGAGGQHVR
ncbi:MAG: hypothetical protein JO147_12470, partial [Actinobacteria bacterium]|nr:hypothetical protein [Actinomycetota bacterium]